MEGANSRSAYVRCFPDDGDREEKKPNLFLSSAWILFGLWLFGSLSSTFFAQILDGNSELYENGTLKVNSRSKRFVYLNSSRQLSLPPGTVLDLEATASLPGIGPLPPGIGSETAISIPFDVDFDTLGLTSSENTFGELQFLTPLIESIENIRKSIAESFGKALFSSIAERMSPQEAREQISKGGGHRPIMYQVVEDTLYNIGIDGKACLLRAICEIHAQPLFGHGLFGEVLELFLSVSSSTSYLHVLGEHLAAEIDGKSSSNCSKYKTKCPLSLFAPLSKKQMAHEQTIRNQFIQDESNYANYHKEGEHNGIKLTRNHVMDMKRNASAMKTLSRQKRFFFFGPQGRLTLPLETILVWKPKIKLPWMTNLPKGYKSGLSIAIPLRLIFDDLGLTSALNPFLQLPFLSTRKKRETWKPLPGVNYAGGDRELIYAILEQSLDTWSIDGKVCLLRAICEMNLAPLANHGFFGEVLHLFLRPSRSPHAAERMKEYCDAEELGKTAKYCEPYFTDCPYSIFISKKEKEKRIAAMNNKIDADEDDVENTWI